MITQAEKAAIRNDLRAAWEAVANQPLQVFTVDSVVSPEGLKMEVESGPYDLTGYVEVKSGGDVDTETGGEDLGSIEAYVFFEHVQQVGLTNGNNSTVQSYQSYIIFNGEHYRLVLVREIDFLFDSPTKVQFIGVKVAKNNG